LFIRSFIYSEISTFGLPKFNKISFVFNIIVPIPAQEMVYLKAMQKITPMDVSVSGTIDRKTYLKKLKGTSAPLAPPWIRLCEPTNCNHFGALYLTCFAGVCEIFTSVVSESQRGPNIVL